MAKIGRNTPCPCGSGKKYKKCCMKKDQAAAAPQPNLEYNVDELDDLSNSVVYLIRDGKLDEAEVACQKLLKQYPDQVDGLDRLAMVNEAKGENEKAAEYFRKAAHFMESHPGFDKEAIEWALREADRVESKATEPDKT